MVIGTGASVAPRTKYRIRGPRTKEAAADHLGSLSPWVTATLDTSEHHFLPGLWMAVQVLPASQTALSLSFGLSVTVGCVPHRPTITVVSKRPCFQSPPLGPGDPYQREWLKIPLLFCHDPYSNPLAASRRQ